MLATVVSAPYSLVPIPLHLTSITGMRYRSIHCIECGAEILERNNETIYRLNDPDLPSEVAISSESIKAKCGRCQQWYGLQVSLSVTIDPDSMPLYMQPQSMYITVEPDKKLRNLHCMECGKSFHSVSDRVAQIVDNRVPFEFLDPGRLGPMEAMCRFNRCSQTWSLML